MYHIFPVSSFLTMNSLRISLLEIHWGIIPAVANISKHNVDESMTRFVAFHAVFAKKNRCPTEYRYNTGRDLKANPPTRGSISDILDQGSLAY